jgi:hypothetical protein
MFTSSHWKCLVLIYIIIYIYMYILRLLNMYIYISCKCKRGPPTPKNILKQLDHKSLLDIDENHEWISEERDNQKDEKDERHYEAERPGKDSLENSDQIELKFVQKFSRSNNCLTSVKKRNCTHIFQSKSAFHFKIKEKLMLSYRVGGIWLSN